MATRQHTDEIAVTDWSGLEVLDLATSLELLASVPVGRVAMIDRGELFIAPVNHVVVGRGIAFRSGIGAKLDAGVMRHLVSFEADDYDVDARTGWSVVVKGRAELVTDPEAVAALEERGVMPWSSPDVRTHWVVVHPAAVTGRRILPT